MSEEEIKINKFLEENKKSHFLQSPEWAKVKTEWEHEFIVVKDKKDNIKGTMSILLRKVPVFNRYIMYAPRGFVADINDKITLRELTNKAIEIAKKYKAFIFRMDPDVSADNEEFKNLMLDLGYKTKKKIKNVDQVIQPKYVFRLDIKDKTEDELLAVFNQKTRYNIRLALKKGVTVRTGSREDLKIFYDILKETGSRDNFYIRPLEYFEKMYDELGKDHIKLIIAEHEGTPIAAVLPVKYGNKVWYLYGGSSNKYRNLMPNYLLQFEMMKWGLENKCEIYDFRGVSGFKNEKDNQYGVYRFKKGFNGDFVEFINELSMVFDPFMNRIFNISQWLFTRRLVLKEKINVFKEKIHNLKNKIKENKEKRANKEKGIEERKEESKEEK